MAAANELEIVNLGPGPHRVEEQGAVAKELSRYEHGPNEARAHAQRDAWYDEDDDDPRRPLLVVRALEFEDN